MITVRINITIIISSKENQALHMFIVSTVFSVHWPSRENPLCCEALMCIYTIWAPNSLNSNNNTLTSSEFRVTSKFIISSVLLGLKYTKTERKRCKIEPCKDQLYVTLMLVYELTFFSMKNKVSCLFACPSVALTNASCFVMFS